jgi:phenylalanyl-tRNA synthetase alpha chain
MKNAEEQLSSLILAYKQELTRAHNNDELEIIRIDYVGRKGKITQLMSMLKTMSMAEKREWGPRFNAFKADFLHDIEKRKEELFAQKLQRDDERNLFFDVTAYQPMYRNGSLHPLTQIVQRIEDIFIGMGFEMADGPEVETPYYNFEALNIPSDHPARDLHDTFWLAQSDFLMRTHTSNVQIRTLTNRTPPVAIFAPGRVFRHEATDATHDYQFMQCEGLVVDKHISLVHLLGTFKTFAQALFDKKNLEMRILPSYFPFVEPGLDIHISCPFCTHGCAICKKTGWMELAGAGLIHPHVLRACNIDPHKYQGFAWGFGIDRLAMLIYGINDIRLLRSNKLEFLSQF